MPCLLVPLVVLGLVLTACGDDGGADDEVFTDPDTTRHHRHTRGGRRLQPGGLGDRPERRVDDLDADRRG
ncbi:MAG: hypothetical protein ABW143_05305, partial [Acidimicrobiales bacterium]